MTVECVGFVVECDGCGKEKQTEPMEYLGGDIGEYLFGPSEDDLAGWFFDETVQLCPECRGEREATA